MSQVSSATFRAVPLAAFMLSGLIAAGCGGGSEESNPPPVEPTDSPVPAVEPAGKVLEIGSQAEGIAVDSKDGIAAVSFRDPDRLELIDVDRERVIGSVAVPESSRHLEIAQDGTTVLVPVEYTDQLLQFDLSEVSKKPNQGKLDLEPSAPSIATADFPHDAVQAANGTIFVGDEGGDSVTVIRDGSVTATLDLPEQPGGVATSGNLLAAGSVAAREVSFYDTDTLANLGVLDAGAGPSHVVAGPDSRFYVADTGGDAILVYEGAPEDGGEPRLVDRANIADSPYAMRVDLTRDMLWVTRTGANRVVGLDVSDVSPSIINSFPTVRQPNSVAVDESSGKVIVVGRVNGEVQIFDPEADGDNG